MRDLTKDERRVIDALADAWALYGNLYEVHRSDNGEFTFAVHAAQNIIMARPAVEAYAEEKKR